MKGLFVLFIFFCLFCGGKGQERIESVIPEKDSSTAERSVLMVIAPKDFRDEEFKEPYDALIKSGFMVVIASTDTIAAKGMLGMIVKPEITLNQVQPDSFDALVIVGGSGSQIFWNDTTLHKIVWSFHDQKKVLAAICIAPVILARAGILNGIKATVSPSVKDEIIKEGAQYTGSSVEIGNHVITASGPDAAKDFAAAILRMLGQ